MSEWISVKDRLPDEEELVLICENKRDTYSFIAFYFHEQNKWAFNDCEFLPDYWMPLPPPKVD